MTMIVGHARTHALLRGVDVDSLILDMLHLFLYTYIYHLRPYTFEQPGLDT